MSGWVVDVCNWFMTTYIKSRGKKVIVCLHSDHIIPVVFDTYNYSLVKIDIIDRRCFAPNKTIRGVKKKTVFKFNAVK